MELMQEVENKADIPVSPDNKEGADGRIYEIGYLFVPTISEENVPAKYSDLKDLIVSLGGDIISDEMPKMINLAYTMQKIIQNVHTKFDNAYFGWVKFEMNPDKVIELKKKLDLDIDFLRFLVMKTVRENTIAARRFVGKDSRKRTPSAKKEGEEEAPMDKEAIDKEIDAMVVA